MTDFLIEMALKSYCIAAAGLTIASMLRGVAPANRANVLRATLALLLALPIISAFAPAIVMEVGSVSPSLASAGGEAAGGSDWFWIAYLSGAVVACAPLGAGLLSLQRWTALARPLGDEGWSIAARRMASASSLGGRVRVLASDAISSPLSWGWRRPTILIDRASLSRPAEAAGILAHEFAHLIRRDWPLLVASHVVAALYWFNPLVWMLKRAVGRASEEAADAFAANETGHAEYAQTLLNCARRHKGRPILMAHGMSYTPSTLAQRVRAVLAAPQRGVGLFWMWGAIIASVTLMSPIAAAEFVRPAPPSPVSARQLETTADDAASMVATDRENTAAAPAVDTPPSAPTSESTLRDGERGARLTYADMPVKSAITIARFARMVGAQVDQNCSGGTCNAAMTFRGPNNQEPPPQRAQGRDS